MIETSKPYQFKKEHLYLGVIAVLLLAIVIKTSWAGDDEALRDSLTKIDSKIQTLEAYKKKVAEELKTKVDEANKEIESTCNSIPESTKSAVDCKKFIQDYKIKISTGTSSGATLGSAPERQGTGTKVEREEGQAEDSPTLRASLNLKDCRFTNDHHRYPARDISFQGVDIACEKGKSFSVYSPDWLEEYEVTSIGKGTNMGNYIILKNGDYHFVYAHTVADKDLKVGTKLGKHKFIGTTNVSGESTGVHLHFELWEGGQNINGRYMVGDKVIYSPDSQKLLDMRGWDWGSKKNENSYWAVYEKAIALLHKEEGLRLKAYPDYKGCSIGYGSRATSCDEVITEAEANRRLAYVVRDLVEQVQKAFPKLHTNGQAALTSFAYNCHQGWVDVKKNGLQQHSLWCKKAGGEVLDVLVKRRAEEHTLIFGE